MTDAQWGVIEPLLPDPAWLGRQGGRRETHCRRTIVDAIFYLVDNDITWRSLPADFPPWSTVYNYFASSEKGGVSAAMLDGLRRSGAPARRPCRHALGGNHRFRFGRGAETVGAASRGYDAGEKINGRKRHIAVDTLGLLLCVLVTAASSQDRDGAKPLLKQLRASIHPLSAGVGRRRLSRQSWTGHVSHSTPASRSSNAART